MRTSPSTSKWQKLKSFTRASTPLSSINQTWSILSARDKAVLRIVVFVQSALSLLDLFGVAIIGSIGALSVYGIQSQDSDNFANLFIKFFQLDNFVFQTQIIVLSIISIVILFIKTVISLLITKKTLEFVSKRGALISGNLLDEILYKSPQEINSYSRQDLVFATTTGVQYLTTGVIGISVSLMADASLLFVLSLGMFVFNPSLAFSTLAIFLIVGGFLNLYFRSKAFKVGSQETRSHVESNDLMIEVLSTLRESRVRDTREYYVRKFVDMRTNVSSAEAKRTFMPFVSKYVMEIAIVVGSFIVAGIQFAMFDAKTAIAGLAIFFGASSRIAPAVLRIQQGFTQIRIYLGHSERTKNLLFPIEKNIDGRKQASLEIDALNLDGNFVPEVQVSNLSFSFSDSNDFRLTVEKLEITPFSHLAIVGASGSGKSTLVDLLLGILTANSGRVTVSGMEPSRAIKKWPGSVGYVPQDTVIASCSVLQNVALGFEFDEVDVQRVKTSLQLAGLEDFMSEDSKGLYLEVGESGHKLSGGQRQRLGIARALYTEPKLLVLDEATSALDSITEFDVTNSLNALKSKITLITIAHRLSTVKNADKVVFLEEGKMIAFGTFDEVRSKVKRFDEQANLLGL